SLVGRPPECCSSTRLPPAMTATSWSSTSPTQLPNVIASLHRTPRPERPASTPREGHHLTDLYGRAYPLSPNVADRPPYRKLRDQGQDRRRRHGHGVPR